MSEREESRETREMSMIVGNAEGWYCAVVAIIANLAEEEEENPFVALAERLRCWIEEELLRTQCPKEFCGHTFQVEGRARSFLKACLNNVDWGAIAREYEADLVREGGNKVSDYEWTWEEADGGEWDGDD